MTAAAPDRFAWLEDLDDPRTRDWLDDQRRDTDAVLAGLAGREPLAQLLRGLIAGPTASPVKVTGSRRFRVGRSRPADPWGLQVTDGPADGADGWRTLVATARFGPGATVRRWTPSPAGGWLAVQVSVGGSESATPLWLVDATTGEPTELTDLTRYAALVWTADERGFYYVRRHDGRPGSGVYHHVLGTDPAADVLLHGDDEPMSRYHVALWQDRWLVFGCRYGTDRTVRLWSVDRAGPDPALARPVDLAGSAASSVLIDPAGRMLAVSTEGAEFGRLVVADPDGTGGWGPWRDLLPERAPAVLSGAVLAGPPDAPRLVVLRVVDGTSSLDVHDVATGALLHPLRLPGAGTVSAVTATGDPDVLTVSYTDWCTPMSVWHADVRTGAVVPADPDDRTVRSRPRISVRRTVYRSFDGVEVPITVLEPPDAAPGPRPTVLTCYGGFGISFRPTFQPDGLAWVLAGGALAVAAVRGGGERGRQWHRDGSGLRKLTAVRDAESAAGWLVATGVTVPDRLALLGGSNGGMVGAAVAVRRPRDYAALAVAGAPLDMVDYERWGLGPAWRGEYGSAADPQARAALLSYSPYHNVDLDRGPLPATLLSAGTDDTRVDPVHARKMAALMQAGLAERGRSAQARGGPVLLRMVEGGGHSGGGDVDRLVVDLLAFLAHHTGLRIPEQVGAEQVGAEQVGAGQAGAAGPGSR